MSSTLWGRRYYTAPINYLNSIYIREYDIRKADISIFLSRGVITQEEYNFYARIPGLARNINMGLLQQSRPELKEVLSKGIEEARRNFFEANDIQDYEVLSITNDAIWLINKIPSITSFGVVQFIPKSVYTSYYRLPKKFNKEFFYYLDKVRGEEYLTIKGMGDMAQSIHRPYMTDFLITLFNSIELYPIDDAISLIQTFYDKYIRRELDINYYRQYGGLGEYISNLRSPVLNNVFTFLALGQNDMDMVDISYNANMIMEFYKIVSSIYFNSRKK